MKQTHSLLSRLSLLTCLVASTRLMAQPELNVNVSIEIPGQAKPILVSMNGLTRPQRPRRGRRR